MSIEKEDTRTGKHLYVAVALLCRVASAMDYLHAWHIGNLALRCYPHGKIEVFEIEKVVFIKAINTFEAFSSAKHETATGNGDILACLLFIQVVHFVFRQSGCE